MKEFVSILDELERKIRENRAPRISDLKLQINSKELPRPLVGRYCNLLRRMGAMTYAIKILSPFFSNRLIKPSHTETLEYSSCLTRIGLQEESIKLLSRIENEPLPEIQFEIAMAYVQKWAYKKAKTYFQKFIEMPDISPYRILVGKVNLAASMVYINEIQGAIKLLNELIPELKRLGHDLLLGNAYELMCHIAVVTRDFDRLSNYSSLGKSNLKSSNPRYLLYLEKWMIVGELLRTNGDSLTLKKTDELRKAAVRISDWDTLREIDLFVAVATRNHEGIKKLYFGVPFEGYRDRIQSMWGKPLTLGTHYYRSVGKGSSTLEKNRVLDIPKGLDAFTGKKLKSGQILHKLLFILTSDFFAPFSTTRVYSLLYPEGRFNPESSPDQIYEVVKRLNRWFKKSSIPMSIRCGKNGYRLRAHEPYLLKIEIANNPPNPVETFIDNLLAQGLIENISLTDVMVKLGLPKRTASRLLSESVHGGKLIRSGKSQTTRYSLANLRKTA